MLRLIANTSLMTRFLAREPLTERERFGHHMKVTSTDLNGLLFLERAAPKPVLCSVKIRFGSCPLSANIATFIRQLNSDFFCDTYLIFFMRRERNNSDFFSNPTWATKIFPPPPTSVLCEYEMMHLQTLSHIICGVCSTRQTQSETAD